MPTILDTLKKDHANLAKLLDALERQIGLFDRAEQLDYDIVGGIVDYCLTYPELTHHPMEDLVLEKLRQRAPEAAAGVGRLDVEHQQLAALTRRFAAAVNNVLQEAEMPRDAIDGLAREFLGTYRTHMKMENEVFFPAAAENLTEADWAEIAERMKETDDALFGSRGEARFARLRDDLLAWDRSAIEA